MGKGESLDFMLHTINHFIGNNTPILVNFQHKGSIVAIQAVWTKEGDNLLPELNATCINRLEKACYEFLE